MFQIKQNFSVLNINLNARIYSAIKIQHKFFHRLYWNCVNRPIEKKKKRMRKKYANVSDEANIFLN